MPDELTGVSESSSIAVTAELPLDFQTAIESSKRLLSLGRDWDGSDAEPVSLPTWTTATGLLQNTIFNIGVDISIPVPTISACRDGSIDLFWKTTKFTLLINIKPSKVRPDFYAETTDGLVLEGTFSREIRDFSVILRALLGK